MTNSRTGFMGKWPVWLYSTLGSERLSAWLFCLEILKEPCIFIFYWGLWIMMMKVPPLTAMVTIKKRKRKTESGTWADIDWEVAIPSIPLILCAPDSPIMPCAGLSLLFQSSLFRTQTPLFLFKPPKGPISMSIWSWTWPSPMHFSLSQE